MSAGNAALLSNALKDHLRIIPAGAENTVSQSQMALPQPVRRQWLRPKALALPGRESLRTLEASALQHAPHCGHAGGSSPQSFSSSGPRHVAADTASLSSRSAVSTHTEIRTRNRRLHRLIADSVQRRSAARRYYPVEASQTLPQRPQVLVETNADVARSTAAMEEANAVVLCRNLGCGIANFTPSVINSLSTDGSRCRSTSSISRGIESLPRCPCL